MGESRHSGGGGDRGAELWDPTSIKHLLIEERQWQTLAQSFRDGGWLYLGLPGPGISQTDKTSYATAKSKLGLGWGLQKLQAQSNVEETPASTV